MASKPVKAKHIEKLAERTYGQHNVNKYNDEDDVETVRNGYKKLYKHADKTMTHLHSVFYDKENLEKELVEVKKELEQAKRRIETLRFTIFERDREITELRTEKAQKGTQYMPYGYKDASDENKRLKKLIKKAYDRNDPSINIYVNEMNTLWKKVMRSDWRNNTNTREFLKGDDYVSKLGGYMNMGKGQGGNKRRKSSGSLMMIDDIDKLTGEANILNYERAKEAVRNATGDDNFNEELVDKIMDYIESSKVEPSDDSLDEKAREFVANS
jgi:hypothetical protein